MRMGCRRTAPGPPCATVVTRLPPSRIRAAAGLLAIGTLPLLVAASRPAEPRVAGVTNAGIVPGSYVAVLANGKKLPWTTQVPAVEGLAHWARLDLAVLRLNPNGRYTLSHRYAQAVVRSDERRVGNESRARTASKH